MAMPAQSVPESYPERIGLYEVELVEEQTRQLRAMDFRSGGGSCLDAVLTLIHRVHGVTRDVDIAQERLDIAVADLYNLAGWACFDIGLVERCQVYFSQALVLAGRGRSDRLVADVLYRLGRVRLHGGDPLGALEYFELGQLAATAAGCELAGSILSMNQAWAHAAMGAESQAHALLTRSVDQFAAARGTPVPGWSRFFANTEMLAMIGTVHTELAHRVNPLHAGIAIPALTEAAAGYGDDMARSRTLCLIVLAVSHMVGGDVGRGVDIGFRALASAAALTSMRVRERMGPLQRAAELRDTYPGALDLAARITTYTTTSRDFTP